MKATILTTVFLLISLGLFAQVSVNTDGADPDGSAMLDVKSTDKGVLVPRVALVSTSNPISGTKPEGLLVWNTSTAGIYSEPGFYYWNGSEWIKISGSGDVSSMIKDADNNTKIQVEETANDDIIRFDMAGTEFFRMDNGRLEVLNTGQSVFIGDGAGANDDFTDNQNAAVGYSALYTNTTGDYNVANGASALYSNTTGMGNVANGASALLSNSSGNFNVANGFGALYTNTSGENNVANGYMALFSNTGSHNVANGASALNSNTTGASNVANGFEALKLTTGDGNVATGAKALESNTTGSYNTAIGYSANVSAGNLTNATAIGANATVSQSNSLVLGNNAANVGIGISAPTAKLHVVGDVKIVNGTQGDGKVLTSDAAGVTGWTDQADLDISNATQTALYGKQDLIIGAATTITDSDLTTDMAVISDGSGKVAVSAVTSAELGYVSGVTSAIQTQLDGKTSSQWTGSTDIYFDGGNVSIGTTTVGEELEVAGDIHASGTIKSGSSIIIDGDNGKISSTSGTLSIDDDDIVTTGNAGIGTSSPDPSAALDVESTTKGLLPPRMTRSERNAIKDPTEGLTLFNITTHCLDYYFNGLWFEVCGDTALQFCCGEPTIDSRDGNTYNTVQIGSQCWMAENMNYSTSNSWCYNDNAAYCNVYGRLYIWDAAMAGATSSNSVPSGVQGVCPSGWHLPSDEEWKILEGEVDSQFGYPDQEWDAFGLRGTDVSLNLREAGTTHWDSPNAGATNSSGFAALPGGRRINGSFYSLGSKAYLWSSTENSSNAWYRNLLYNETQVDRGYTLKSRGFSCRCLKD